MNMHIYRNLFMTFKLKRYQIEYIHIRNFIRIVVLTNIGQHQCSLYLIEIVEKFILFIHTVFIYTLIICHIISL